MTKKTVFLLLACIILGFLGGWLVRKRTAEPVVTDTRRDTVWVETSVSLDSFTLAESHPAAPVLVPRDSVQPAADSSMLALPAVTKTFRDTTENVAVEAIVTGVDPQINHIVVSYLSPSITTTRTIVKPFKGWKMSVTSNNAVSTMALQSLDGLEFSYTTGPFQFGLQAGALVTKPFPGDVRVEPYLGGRITVDILKFQ